MISLTKILNKLYLTKFSFYLLLFLILISFSITFYLMLPNNNLVKNPIQLQYFLLADIFFVILLLALIIRQLILIIIHRRNQKDESKLYIKFVNLFTAMAVGPAIGLVIITSLFSIFGINFEESFKLGILTLMNTVNSSMYGLNNFNFLELNSYTKLIMIIFMIIGRVELLTILIIVKKFIFKS